MGAPVGRAGKPAGKKKGKKGAEGKKEKKPKKAGDGGDKAKKAKQGGGKGKKDPTVRAAAAAGAPDLDGGRVNGCCWPHSCVCRARTTRHARLPACQRWAPSLSPCIVARGAGRPLHGVPVC